MATKKIKIRTKTGIIASIPADETMKEVADEWCVKVADRSSWAGDSASRKKMQSAAEDAVWWLGLDSKKLKKIALSGVVEIVIPYEGLTGLDDALRMPWEYLLSASSKRYRGDYSLCVLRHLDCKSSPSRKCGPA